MKDLETRIKDLIDKQPKCESLDCYDDHGMYFNAGFYEGYVEALEEVIKLINKEE